MSPEIRRPRLRFLQGLRRRQQPSRPEVRHEFSFADRIAALPPLTRENMHDYEALAAPYITPPAEWTPLQETRNGTAVTTEIPFDPNELERIVAGKKAVETILGHSGTSGAAREALDTIRFFPSTREGAEVQLRNRQQAVLSIMAVSNMATKALQEWMPTPETIEAFLTLRQLPNFLIDHTQPQTT